MFNFNSPQYHDFASNCEVLDVYNGKWLIQHNNGMGLCTLHFYNPIAQIWSLKFFNFSFDSERITVSYVSFSREWKLFIYLIQNGVS